MTTGRVVDTANTQCPRPPGGPIPRVLHRIWLTDPLPGAFAGYWERARELHPDWRFRDWRTYSEVPWQLCHHRGLMDRAADICPNDAKRFVADILRLELLWIYGGVYIDADVEPLRPWDPLTDCEAFIGRSPNRGPKGERLLTQCVMGARPHHPFIGACLQAVPGSVDRHAGRPLAQMVGPWMVTRVWESRQWDDVTVLPEHTFGPVSIRQRDRGETVDTSGSYAVHHWNSSARRRGKGAA